MMYNQNESKSRRLRALVLAPALGAALFVTNLSAVADVIDAMTDVQLAYPNDKVSENISAYYWCDFIAPVVSCNIER